MKTDPIRQIATFSSAKLRKLCKNHHPIALYILRCRENKPLPSYPQDMRGNRILDWSDDNDG